MSSPAGAGALDVPDDARCVQSCGRPATVPVVVGMRASGVSRLLRVVDADDDDGFVEDVDWMCATCAPTTEDVTP